MANSREHTTTEEKSNEGPDHLSDLPGDLLKYSLFRLLPSSALVQLGKTNQRFANFPEREEAKRVLERLLYFVSHGQKDQAEILISRDPDLLLLEGKARDYSGRKLQGTALEIALGAEDVNLYANNGKLIGEGMVEMLQRHLRELPGGEATIARQTLKQFPKGWEKQEEKKHEENLKALRKVRDAIKASSSNEACEEAILEFKKHLAPKEAITTGKHWNAKLLQAAFEMGYSEYFNDYRKDNLFYNKVVVYVQSLAPANYAMAQAQGLWHLLAGEGKKFKRNLKLKWDYGSAHYYPLSSSEFRLGSDFWVNGYLGWAVERACWVRWFPTVQLSRFFHHYVEAKTKVLLQLVPQSDNHRNASPDVVKSRLQDRI